MNQIQIGRFIADSRRARNLTQRQLADALSISDKTVSKWECGKGLPEVSQMLPLCAALEITVNDLLSGERVAEADYRKKAEENMMELIRENAENRLRMAQSIVCSAVTVIAVAALVFLASFLALPSAARIGLLVFAVAAGVAGLWAAATLEVRAGYYECPSCKAKFVPTMPEYVKGYHTLTKRRLTCPQCGERNMCRHKLAR